MMRPQSYRLILSVAVIVFGGIVSPAGSLAQIAEDNDGDTITAGQTTAAPQERDLEVVVDQIVSQTQAFRQQHDRDTLEINAELTETAEYFAQYMARTGSYGHGADGRRPSERAKAHGYDYCLVSENIANLYSSQPLSDEELAQRLVEGWQESPEHRENMLEPAVTQIGVAVAQSEESGYYFAVQMFGRPESAAIRFEISNQSDQVVRYEIGDRVLELPPRYTRMHQRCRSGAITFLGDEAEEQDEQTIQPQSGDRFTVTHAEGRLEVRRTADDAEANSEPQRTSQVESIQVETTP